MQAAIAECERPLRRIGNKKVEPLREKLYDTMWEKVGIIREEKGLRDAAAELQAIDAELDRFSLADANRAFNLAWHDWLNLKSLVAVSRAIAAAALARKDSRGAHFRSDYPEASPLEHSAFTSLREGVVTMKPVAFTRVRPGETLLRDAA